MAVLWLLAACDPPSTLAPLTLTSEVRLGTPVFVGDVDTDGRDDLAWACGTGACVSTGALAPLARFETGTSPTDPRYAAVSPAGAGLLWIGPTLRDLGGRVVATAAVPPAAAGFDADGDGAADLLAVVGGRAVLSFGPFSGKVENNPDAPGFDGVVYTLGGVDGDRAWWLPDAFGPGRGGVALQCTDDCAGDVRTAWWEAGRTDDFAGWFGLEDAGGAQLVPLGDLDTDGTGEALVDDGAGGWSHADLGWGPGRPRTGLGRASVAVGLGALGVDGWALADGARLTLGGPAGDCLSLDAGFTVGALAAGTLDGRPALLATGRGAAGPNDWRLALWTGDTFTRELRACGR